LEDDGKHREDAAWTSSLGQRIDGEPSCHATASFSETRSVIPQNALYACLGRNAGAGFVGVVEVAGTSRFEEILTEALRREIDRVALPTPPGGRC